MANNPNGPIQDPLAAPQAMPVEPTKAQSAKLTTPELMAVNFNPDAYAHLGKPSAIFPINYHQRIIDGLNTLQTELGYIPLKVGDITVSAESTGEAKDIYTAIQQALNDQPSSDEVITTLIKKTKKTTNDFTTNLQQLDVESVAMGSELPPGVPKPNVSAAIKKTINELTQQLKVVDTNKADLDTAQKAEKAAVEALSTDTVDEATKQALLGQLNAKHQQQNKVLKKKQQEHEHLMRSFLGGAAGDNDTQLAEALQSRSLLEKAQGALHTALGHGEAVDQQALQQYTQIKQELQKRDQDHEGGENTQGGIKFAIMPGSISCTRGIFGWGDPEASGIAYAKTLMASSSHFKIKEGPNGQSILDIKVETLDRDPATMEQWRPMLAAAQRYLATEYQVTLNVNGTCPPIGSTAKERKALLEAIHKKEAINAKHAEPKTTIMASPDDGSTTTPATSITGTPNNPAPNQLMQTNVGGQTNVLMPQPAPPATVATESAATHPPTNSSSSAMTRAAHNASPVQQRVTTLQHPPVPVSNEEVEEKAASPETMATP